MSGYGPDTLYHRDMDLFINQTVTLRECDPVTLFMLVQQIDELRKCKCDIQMYQMNIKSVLPQLQKYNEDYEKNITYQKTTPKKLTSNIPANLIEDRSSRKRDTSQSSHRVSSGMTRHLSSNIPIELKDMIPHGYNTTSEDIKKPAKMSLKQFERKSENKLQKDRSNQAWKKSSNWKKDRSGKSVFGPKRMGKLKKVSAVFESGYAYRIVYYLDAKDMVNMLRVNKSCRQLARYVPVSINLSNAKNITIKLMFGLLKALPRCYKFIGSEASLLNSDSMDEDRPILKEIKKLDLGQYKELNKDTIDIAGKIFPMQVSAKLKLPYQKINVSVMERIFSIYKDANKLKIVNNKVLGSRGINLNEECTSELCLSMIHQNPNLTSVEYFVLDSKFMETLNDLDPECLRQAVSHLRSIKISNYLIQNIDDLRHIEVLKHFPSLKKLSLGQILISTPGHPLSALPTPTLPPNSTPQHPLSHPHTHTALSAILHTHTLTHLHIGHIATDGLLRVIASTQTRLVSLGVNDSNITGDGLQAILAGNAGIEVVDLSRCWLLEARWLERVPCGLKVLMVSMSDDEFSGLIEMVRARGMVGCTVVKVG